MKSHLIIIIIVAAAVLIVGGASYSLLSKPSPTEPPSQVTPPTGQPPPPNESKPPPEQSAPTFEEKIDNFTKAIADVCATGKSKEITLVFSETEANDQAAKLLAQAEIPEDIPLEIESVYIDFQSDNNVLTEARSVIYNKFKVTIKVKAKVGIEEGRPEVEVTSISFGFVPLPEPLKDRIVGLITQKIDDLQAQLTEAELGCNGKIDLEFTDINIQQSKVTITVIIKPRA